MSGCTEHFQRPWTGTALHCDGCQIGMVLMWYWLNADQHCNLLDKQASNDLGPRPSSSTGSKARHRTNALSSSIYVQPITNNTFLTSSLGRPFPPHVPTWHTVSEPTPPSHPTPTASESCHPPNHSTTAASTPSPSLAAPAPSPHASHRTSNRAATAAADALAPR